MNEENSSTKVIDDDRPIKNIADDLLERAGFARELAMRIVVSPPAETIVLAVTGPWGAGKTSFLNMLSYAIAKYQRSPPVRQVTFKPWYFSSIDDLVLQLNWAINPEEKRRGRIRRYLAKNLAKYTSVIAFVGLILLVCMNGRLTVPAASVTALVTIAAFTIASLSERPSIYRSGKTLRRDRTEPLVVMIDEIDRWEKEAVVQLMRLVKLGSDLKNTTFVLAFNNDIVARHLDAPGVSGDEYLEKIVQFSFPLPEVEGAEFEKLALKLLNKVLANSADDEVSILDCPRMKYFIESILLTELTTLRALKRYCSSLSFTRRGTVGKVDTIDFMAMELLRTKYVAVHHGLQIHKDGLVGPYNSYDRPDQQRFFLERLADWLPKATAMKRRRVFEIMCFLFPRLLGTEQSSMPQGVNGLHAALVSKPEFFDSYYTLSSSPLYVNDVQIRTFLAASKSNKRSELDAMIPDFNDVERVERFIHRFANIGPEKGEMFAESVEVLFEYLHEHDVRSDYIQMGRHGAEVGKGFEELFTGPSFYLNRLIKTVATQRWLEPAPWKDAISSLVSSLSALNVAVRIVEEMNDLGTGWETLGVENAMREDIVAVLNDRIVDEATSGALWHHHNLGYIIEHWIGVRVPTDPPPSQAPIDAVRAHVADDSNFIQFIDSIRFPTLQKYHLFKTQKGGSTIDTLLPELIVRQVFDDRETIVDRLEQISNGSDEELASRAKVLVEELREEALGGGDSEDGAG